MLLDMGSPVDHLNKLSAPPLQLATYRSHAPIVELLVNAGANPSTGRLPTPFMIAVQHKEKELIRLLLKSDKVDVVSMSLHYGHQLSTVQYLSNHGKCVIFYFYY
jgi:ankyrin repeat protein